MNSINRYRELIQKDIISIESHLNTYSLNKLDIEIAIGFIKSETGKVKETGYKKSTPYLNLAMPSNTFFSALTLCKQRTPEFKSLRDVNYVSYKRAHDENNYRDIPLSTSLILVSLALHVFNISSPEVTGFSSILKKHELSRLVESVKDRDLIITANKLKLPRDTFDTHGGNGIDYTILIKKIDERVNKQRLTKYLKDSEWANHIVNNANYASNIDGIIDELVHKLTS